jgi:hypothetical protein
MKTLSATALRAHQLWMQSAITHPSGSRVGIMESRAGELSGKRAHSIVRRSRSLTSLERVEIYADMYFLRLLECLGGEFASVRHAVGEEKFNCIAREYLTKHPSRHYSLNMLGAKFSAFLRNKRRSLEHRTFLAELAELERTIEVVFDENQRNPVAADALRSVAPGDWHRTRLTPIAALRLLSTKFPVNAYLQAVREARMPSIPDARRSYVCVYRKDYSVWRADLNHAQYVILQSLSRGETIGGAVEACLSLPRAKPEEILRSIGAWFGTWAGQGMFADVQTG